MRGASTVATVMKSDSDSPTNLEPIDPTSSTLIDRPVPAITESKLSKTSPDDSSSAPQKPGTAHASPFTKVLRQNAVRPIAEWQGYVTKVDEHVLHATMSGVFGEAIVGRRHDAVIPLSEVSPEDMGLVREGAYFRLSISYAVSRGGTGTSTRQSTVVFRRLPAYRKADIDAAQEFARELLGGIRLE